MEDGKWGGEEGCRRRGIHGYQSVTLSFLTSTLSPRGPRGGLSLRAMRVLSIVVAKGHSANSLDSTPPRAQNNRERLLKVGEFGCREVFEVQVYTSRNVAGP